MESRSGEFRVVSAGISTMDGFPASPETIEVMKSEGIDVTSHRSRQLTPDMVHAADKIFVMEGAHKDWILRFAPDAEKKVFLMTEFHSLDYGISGEADIPDPIRMSDSFYRNVLLVIRNCIKKIIESFQKGAT